MLGLITEYNPFHNGHLFHLNSSKKISEKTKTIVVMSGNFVQRGEPAIFNKHIRTKMALLNGVDIVLELPMLFATAGADLFALGAVDLLNKTNLVTNICFGSEKGDIENFKDIVNLLTNEPEDFKNNLKFELKKGSSFPLARANAIKETLNLETDFLKTPNNILGLEYLISLSKTNSKITPLTIKRKNSSFHSTEVVGKIASATAIRKLFAEEDIDLIKTCIPSSCFNLVKELLPVKVRDINSYSQVLNYILRASSPEDIKKIADVTEGLENRMLKNINRENFLITDFIKEIKTKRYTYAKLQKAMLHIILGITKDDQLKAVEKGLNQYIRVLGFRKESQDLVSRLCKKASVPVITNISKATKILNEQGLYILNKEIKSTDVFYLNSNVPINREYREPLVII